ncbi:hypothetical protein [Pseudonocardia sp. HH130630-07]|uniref:hypothetical protein n=1 Tax=Pseudonocardia sp. HH130630-07 TaxID=1690815 RepID=UPI000814C7AF|nr:hypothetical protein [Pseudonocardia sp. HH130630-07]ANY05607.1 hypothetical protein AFB00_04000 [Pseudonocardia sp. HH130630-07]
MPSSRFDRTSWPSAGPHRELLELLDAVHVRNGSRSARVVGRAMHVSAHRVHEIGRGAALPADEEQVRVLLAALAGGGATEQGTTDRAVELFVVARRERDGAGPWPVHPVPAVWGRCGTPAAGTGDGAPVRGRRPWSGVVEAVRERTRRLRGPCRSGPADRRRDGGPSGS